MRHGTVLSAEANRPGCEWTDHRKPASCGCVSRRARRGRQADRARDLPVTDLSRQEGIGGDCIEGAATAPCRSRAFGDQPSRRALILAR